MKGKDWREALIKAPPPIDGLFEELKEITEPASKQMDNAVPEPINLPPMDWKRFRVSVKEKIPEDEVLLRMGDKVLISRGNIGTTSGKPKSCKTFLISAMGGVCISGNYLGMTTTLSNLKVLLIDTEQGRARAQKVQKRIHRICGLSFAEDLDRLTIVSVREIPPPQRLDTMRKAMAEIRPDFVIVDGVRDLLFDFNKIEESTELVNTLMALSTEYNCGIMTVIHQNKGDVNARGHLGAELMNKSETALEVRRVDKISTVSPVHCRNIEFNEFSFWINQEGLPELCDTPPNKENKEEELRKLVNKAMFGSSQMLKLDLRKKLEETTGLTERTANRKIKEAIAGHILEVVSDDSKMVRLVVELDNAPDEDDSTPEDDLPF